MTKSTFTALLVGLAAALAAVLWMVGGSTAEEATSTATPMEEAPVVDVVAETGAPVGYAYAVAVYDSIAVFNRGAELVVLDVTDPHDPLTLSSLTMPGPVRDIVLSGSLAFVATDSAGLQIVDVSRDAAIVGSFPLEDRAQGVAVDGRHAFVAARSEGLRVMDISDPANPVEVGHILLPDEAVDVVVRDGYAYIAAWYESMRVVDVSDPSHPEEVSFASFDSYDNGAAWTVYVEGDIGLNTIPEMGLRTVDISDPRDVKLHKVYRGLFAPAGVAARGKVTYVADQSAGFRVLDLSNPAQRVEIGAVELAGTPLHVVLGGDYAYVAAREGGLRIVDISAPNDPTEVAYVDVDDEIVDVAYAGESLYAAGSENGIYSVSRGLKPFAAGPSQRVRIAEDGVAVAGKHRIEFFDPAGSETRTPLAVQAHGFATRGGLTVAAAGTNGLQLFDGDRLVGRFIPQRLRSDSLSHEQFLRTPVVAWDVILDGDLAIGAFDDGIRMIDVSNPSRPKMISALAVPQRVYRLAQTDSLLFAAGDDGVRLYRKGTWSELAYVKTPSFATALVVQDGLAYVGDLSGMVTVVDVAKMLAHSEASPSGHSDAAANRIGIYKVADRVHGLDVSGDELAVAAGREGVRVVRLSLLKN